MARYADWPERLYAFLNERASVPFAWGTNDCCLFAADAVLAITGRDFALDARGQYSDENEANALLASLGGVAGVADTYLERVPVAFAQRGDIVAIDTPSGEALGVLVGPSLAVVTRDGLAYLRAAHAKIAWRVA